MCFGVFLIANTKSFPQSDYPILKPSLQAGASKFPIIEWQNTEILAPLAPMHSETVATEEPAPESIASPAKAPAAIPEAETPAGQEGELVDESMDANGNPPIYDVTFFAKAVQAEGYTLGYEGMRYIASAIINLARDRGCSVDAVLQSGAYTVVNTGVVWNQNLYPETWAAVKDELNGQIDTDIKYFRTNHFHNFGTPCFSYGNVYFSK